MSAVVYDIATGKPRYAFNPGLEVAHEDLEYLDQIAKRKNETTPDYLKLKLQKHYPVFVYGNLKSGGLYSALLKDSPFLGEGITNNISYQMSYFEGLFNQPILKRIVPSSINAARVMGEVYVVTPEQILEIDAALEHTQMFVRENAFVKLRDQTYMTKEGEKNPTIKCIVYLAGIIGMVFVPVRARSSMTADRLTMNGMHTRMRISEVISQYMV